MHHLYSLLFYFISRSLKILSSIFIEDLEKTQDEKQYESKK